MSVAIAAPPVVEYDDGPPRKYTVNGKVVPSVTQVLGCLAKDALPWWGMQVGVRGLLHLRNLGVEIPWDDDEGACKLLIEHKLTVNHVVRTAAVRGQGAHDALEQWATDGRVPRPSEFPAEDRGFIQALARALMVLRPEVEATEVVVGSAVHGFAGRYDMRAVSDGRRVRLDLKTGKAVYPTHMLQLAGYEIAALEMGEEPSDRQLVVRLGAGGEFEIVESHATGDMFLGVLAAYRSLQELKAAKPRKPRAKKAA